MPLYTGSEKRRHKRMYKLMAVNIMGFDNKKTLPKLDAEVGQNISEGGILLECSKRLPKGTSLKLKIMLLFDSKYKIIQTFVRIIWNKKSFRKTYYLGCKFTRLKHKDRLLLRRFVSFHLDRKLCKN